MLTNIMKRILLIGGRAGSGKDTVADFIINNSEYTKLSLADGLKDYVSNKYDLDRELLNSQEGKKTKMMVNGDVTDIRSILIKEGMNKRHNDINCWVRPISEKINKSLHNSFVIPDFRFPNEYEFLSKTAGPVCTLLVVNPRSQLIDSISERSLNDFNFHHVINNDSTLEKLYDRVNNIDWSN